MIKNIEFEIKDYDTSFLKKPVVFEKHSIDDILKINQVAADKVSGGFTGVMKHLNKGEGFVARLFGSTAEAISMWHIMMFGKYPFIMDSDGLKLNLKPILTKEFFKEDGTLTVKFSSIINITYHTKLDNTFDLSDVKYFIDGKEIEINDKTSKDIRLGKYKNIDVYLK